MFGFTESRAYKIVWLFGLGFRFIEPKIYKLRHERPCAQSKMATCAKRRDLSLAEKVDFLDKIHLQPPGTSHRRLAEIFGIPKGRLVCNESELRKQLLEEHAQRIKSSRKRKRSSKDAEVDEALNQWLRVVLARSVRISGPMLKSKAEEFARRLGSTDFVATDGWLSRWKARHDIKFKRAHGEKQCRHCWSRRLDIVCLT